MHKQENGQYAAESGDLVWWCGGYAGPNGKPEIRINLRDGLDAMPHDWGSGVYVLNSAHVFCTGCGRMAPEQNGCRYVEKLRLEELGEEE